MIGFRLRAVWLSLAVLLVCVGHASAQVQATLSASFTPSTVLAGGSNTSSYDLIINNPNGSALTGIAVSVTFPSGITRGNIGAISCSGSGSISSSGFSFTVTSLAAGQSCELPTFVQADSSASGPILVTSSTVTSNEVGTPGPAASATLTVTPLAATSFSVVAATPVTIFNQDSITITCLDQRGSTFTSYAGMVNLTSTEDPSLVYSSGNPVVLSSGTGTFNVAPKKSGTFTITATDSVNSSITGTSNVITANPGPTVGFLVSAASPQTAGTGFNFTVTAVDLFDNTTPAYSGTVSFSSSDGLAVLPGSSTLTNGTGTFSATLHTPGSQTITATDTPNSLNGTSSAIQINAVSPPTLAKAFGTGSIAINATTSLTFTIANPNASTSVQSIGFSDTLPAGLVVATPNGQSGTCLSVAGGVLTAGTPSAVAGGGSISLSGLRLAASASCTFAVNVKGTTAGAKSNTTGAITSLEGGTGSTATANLTVGAATHFSVSASSPQTAGSAFNFTVTALDSGNSTATAYTGTVHFTSSDGSATLPANTTLTNGVGTLSATLKTAGTQTITATDTVTSSITGTSSAITVTPAAATHFTVSAPGSAGPNTAFNFTVTALDLFNNTATGYAGTVHFTSSDGTAVLPANSTLSNGAGTLSATLNTLGNQTITATDTVTSSITGTSGTISVAGASSFVVTTLADSGAGSLRAAINNSNASVGGGAITFSVTGTIHLLSALPVLTQSATITGPGASSLAIDGGGTVQVFNIGGGITVSISGVTIRNGLASGFGGGGILNQGSLTLSSCVITGNLASSVSELFGGGIFNAGTLTMNQCTVSNNTTSVPGGGGGAGGGLYNSGPATITNSTFSGNTAAGQGNGGGIGGAIFNSPAGTLTIVGSTITGNKVTADPAAVIGGGGAILDAGTLVVNNSTISGNSQTGTASFTLGGGIAFFSPGTCKLTNTILAGNTDANSSPNPDGSGTFIDGGNNLIGDGTGITGITNGVNGDQVGTSGTPLNPQLGALANNGGPTKTMLPGGNSPALGAGNPAGFLNTDTDQRGTGFLRLANSVMDIGAVQLQGVALTATAGTPQSVGIGAAVATNLAARATESCAACSSVVPGVTVTLTAPGSGASGTFAGGVNTAITNSIGVATAQSFTANMILGGPYTVSASATTPDQASPATADFTLTNVAPNQTITGFGPLGNRTYGDTSFAILGVAATSGLPVSFASNTPSVCTVMGSTVTINAAGICSIIAGQVGNSTFPAAPNVTQSFTVNKAVLTVTANNASKPAGAPLPTFSATITGFVHGDTSAVVSGSPSLTTTASTVSPAGDYAIIVTKGTLSAVNYTFVFVNGDLTVTAPQPASISVVSGSGQAGALGNPFAAPLVAVVKDGVGSKVSGVFVTFSVASGSATLSATEVATGFDGTAQITATPTSTGAITILASVGGLSVPATFNEIGLAPSAAAQLSVLPAALAFTVIQGGSNPLPASIAISNTGAGTLPWTASASGNPSWLKLSPLSGSTPAVTTASIDTTGLMAGSYQSTITVTSGSQHQTVAVMLTVSPPVSAEFALSPAAIIVNAAAGSTTPIMRVIQVPNAGTGALAWTATPDPDSPWLSVSPASGSSAAGKPPSTVTVQINPSGLGAGQYLGNIAFSGPGVAPANVAVVLNLSALPDLISSVPVLEFRGLAGSSFAPQTLSVSTTPGAAVSFTANASVATGLNWLTLGGASGATPGSISVSANASGLGAGYYIGYISIGSTGAGNTLVVPVVLDLGSAGMPGTLSATPGGVLFTGSANSAPLSRTIAISSDSGSFSWNAVALAGLGGTWLAVSPASGSANGNAMVTANLTGLAPGSYNGQVLISATGTSNTVLIIPVTLIVSSGTTPVTPSNTLQPIQPAGDFIANVGVPVALQASILSPTGTPVTGANVQVAFTTGDEPVILTDVGGGAYTGVWTPLHAGAASLLFTSPNSPAGVVTGVVLASSSNPAFPGAGIVNAAPMISGAPLGIGSIATMFGLNLASDIATAATFPLPLKLGGATVTINGIPAPLFYASPLQINFFVPYELAGQTSATILVSTATGLAEVTGIPITPQSPGLFLTNAAGDPAVIHANGQPVSASSPAAGGEIVEIFATGLGPVTNAPADNAAAPTSPLAMDKITPRVIIGGVDAEVKFAGLAPGFAGLNQINVVVPKGLPAGPATVTLAVGSLFGNTAVMQVR